MRKRSGTKKTAKATPERDPNQSAFDMLQKVMELTGDTAGKNPIAVALGRLGGLKGGKARAEKLSKKERSASAKKAAEERWRQYRDDRKGK